MGKKGSKVKDAGYIDSTLSSLFLHALALLSLSSLASAMGGTRWPLVEVLSGPSGSGLCVVINGNLKQRELTISFFISSRRCSVARPPTLDCEASTRTHEARPQKGSFLGGW